MPKSPDECQPWACMIQDCLQKNNYQQEKCEHIIQKMLDCCEFNASRNFASCDGFKFQLQKRIKAREQSNGPSPSADGKRPSQPYYLTAIPWYKRHPRLFIFGGGTLVASIVFSAPIYHFLFTTEKDVEMQSTLWKHEIETGIRDIDVLRAKIAAAGPNATIKQVFDTPPDYKKMPPTSF
ncbi:unnamed protein product [Allacma fusca]|uniref:Cx9C motif-containing protein 4, mitochondrial n=1 Tax=Allacma fusca TaxID=39272 RepID=A0A8J2PYH4_9HEXA|nr:unnamed protein product [Allacma fusca]